MVIFLMACVSAEPEVAADPVVQGTELLIRASLDLRGVRPSVQEMERIEDDPASYEDLVQEMLDDPRFESRVRDQWAEILLTRSEAFAVGPESFGMGDAQRAEFEASIGEEALRLIGHVAANDLPWTQVVTADYTLANPMLTEIWPVTQDAPSSGWEIAHYQDGRPHVGILSTNSMWWRYTTTTSNANRKRANTISRVLLCNDYLKRPIEFDRNINLLDEGAVQDALQTDPACVNCHNSMDPIASYFFGFFSYDPANPLEVVEYHPERELLWKTYIGAQPAWYGTPGHNLSDLGQQIAGDPRFVECAVEQAWESSLRREALPSDADALTAHREAFLEGELTWKALMASIVSDPLYQAAGDQSGGVAKKMATPDLLSTQVQDLTGFTWSYEGYDLMRTDRVGFRLLAGGADGTNVTQSASGPNATIVLVQERLAQASSWYAASADAAGEGPGLFTEVDFSETDTSDPAMAAQVQALHFRIFGTRVAADGPEVQANLELWQALFDVDQDPTAAWAGVLSVLLRDPDLLLY